VDSDAVLGEKVQLGEYAGLGLVEEAGRFGWAQAHLSGTVVLPAAARKGKAALDFP